ncbi:MAG TPA: HPr family phosphocarrier protein [Candidatus Limnocylindrales bacterium]|nr:HPr family phosphocarrier protein [Candidatus Limnocylindrales bacterium]
MTSVQLVVRNPSGLHARPAALFVRTAGAFRAAVQVRNLTRDGAAVDAKSILALMGTGVSAGHLIEVIADGPDEAEAIEAIREAVESGLGEAVG